MGGRGCPLIIQKCMTPTPPRGSSGSAAPLDSHRLRHEFSQLEEASQGLSGQERPICNDPV